MTRNLTTSAIERQNILNNNKELLGKIIHFVINGQELDEETKIEVIHAMEKSPLFSEPYSEVE